MRPAVRRAIARVLVAACIALPLYAVVMYALNPLDVRSLDPRERIFGVGLYRIPASSMAPALRPGDVILVRAGARAVASVRRGDIVTFNPPHHDDQRWIKRVVALAGERVELRDGVLLVDGRAIAEPYVEPGHRSMRVSRDFGPRRVRDGHVFLLGDNRDNSDDSRFWGDLSTTRLHGRALQR